LEHARAIRISDGLSKLIDDTAAGRRSSIDLPFGMLGRLSFPFLPGAVALLCGTPGAGKSFYILQCLLYWLTIGVRFAAYMLEEDREHHLNRALAMLEKDSNLVDPDWLKSNGPAAKRAYENHADTLDKLGERLSVEPEKLLKYDNLLAWVKREAKDGCRIICIDPITAVEQNDKPWVADIEFLMAVKKIAIDYGSSILLVTHPRKGNTAPGLDDLAGGAAFQRFSQTIFWLEFHKKVKEVEVRGDCGTFETKVNRTIHICKARNGRGNGFALGFNFSGESLLFAEQGIIVK